MSATTSVQLFQSRVRRATAELREKTADAKYTKIPKLLQIVELLKLQQSLQESKPSRSARDKRDSKESSRTLRSAHRVAKDRKPSLVADISGFDYRKRQRYFMRKYCDIWSNFFESQLYQNWRQGRPWQLCCYGEPGCGKSTLAAAIAENLNKHYADGAAITISMFLDERDRNGRHIWQTSKQDSIMAFRLSMIRQLIEIQSEKGCDATLQQMMDLATSVRSKLSIDSASAIDSLLASLRESTPNLKIFMVIDGLDNCPIDIQDVILHEVARLGAHYVTMRQQPLSIAEMRACDMDGCGSAASMFYYRCRQCEHMTKDICFPCYEQGLLCDTHGMRYEETYTDLGFGLRSLDEEITRYIKWEIERELLATPFGERLSRTEDIMQKIEETITSKANGALVIARIFIEYLIKEQTEHELLDSLSHVSLPEAAYFSKIMARVSEQSPSERKLGLTCLRLISTAYKEAPRRITFHELAAACNLIKDPEVAIVSEHQLLRVCQSSITIFPDDLALEPFHNNLATYIYEECTEVLMHVEADLATLCLQCILQSGSSSGPGMQNREVVEDDFAKDPLLSYAVQSWGFHLAVDPSTSAKDMAMELFRNEEKLALYLLRASFSVALNTDSGASLYLWPGCRPIHVCAFFGLTNLLDDLLKQEPTLDINAQDPVYERTPLMIACMQGHFEFVQRLLDYEADVSRRCARQRTVFEEAIDKNDFDLFVTLMLHGASSVSEVLQKQLAFAAATSGSPLFLQNLVETIGIEVNVDDDDGNPLLLHTIADGSQENLACLLRRSDLNLFRTNYRGETALHAAASTDFERLNRIVETLREREQLTSIDARESRSSKTATMIALESEQMPATEALDLLIGSGASLSVVDSRMRSLAHYAAAYCLDEDCLQLLRDKGAAIDLRDTDGWTPLHVACWARNSAAASMLIDSGVDLAARDHRERTPLEISELYDPCDASGIASLLMSRVDTTTSTDIARPLWSVVRNDDGVDDIELAAFSSDSINMVDPFTNDTLLHWAVLNEDPEPAKKIIGDGRININAQNRDGHTALSLHCARFAGPSEEMVRLLLEHGADQTISLNTEHNPFVLASKQGYWESALAMFDHDDGSIEVEDHLQQLLDTAIQAGRRSSIEKLLDAGADILCPVNGTLPAEVAKTFELEQDIYKMLVEKEAAVLENFWPKTPPQSIHELSIDMMPATAPS